MSIAGLDLCGGGVGGGWFNQHVAVTVSFSLPRLLTNLVQEYQIPLSPLTYRVTPSAEDAAPLMLAGGSEVEGKMTPKSVLTEMQDNGEPSVNTW